MKKLEDCSLYTFVDWNWLNGRNPLSVASDLVNGGSDIIQLRAKALPPEQIEPIAFQIQDICSRAGVLLVINDFLDVARKVTAPLCHLGQEDFFDSGFKNTSELNPGDVQIGLSTHSPEQAFKSLQANPAYIAIGPVFRTDTKPTATPVTLEYVTWASQNVKIPWFAIGGITLDNLDLVLNAGARRICVVSAILNSADIVQTCQQFKKRLSSAPR